MPNSMRMLIIIAAVTITIVNRVTIVKPGLVGQDNFRDNAIEMKVAFNKSIKFG